MQFLVEKIKNALNETLPGRQAQFEMTNIHRELNYVVPENARDACVLLLLFPIDKKMHLAFIQRASKNPKDPHSGQVSFPGGKFESGDESLLACALREANEEVGVIPSEIEVLGALTQLYIPISNFNVYPFVGFLPEKPAFILQESEVKSLLVFSVEHFLNPENKGLTDITVQTFSMKNVPYFKAEDLKIWGATSMILNEFLATWKNVHPYVEK
jgi:8-oxo-dGTP pyrophosphatase MutT (NUDIX family)